MIDAGSDGICILANWSEQFTLADHEQVEVMHVVLEHACGRVPVIVTTTHAGSLISAERSLAAETAGASMVMLMPPYHRATMRFSEKAVFEFIQRVADALRIPMMIKDAPISGTVLSGPFLARLAREIPNVRYLKIETPQAASKLREIVREIGHLIEGPWDAEEGITIYPDVEAGATGTMTGAGVPDGIKKYSMLKEPGGTMKLLSYIRSGCPSLIMKSSVWAASREDPDGIERGDSFWRHTSSASAGRPGNS